MRTGLAGRSILAAILFLMVAPGGAGAAKPESGWQQYVLGPGSGFVKPERVRSVSGAVSGAGHLLQGGRGTTTLKMEPGGPEAVVTLDFGRTVSGIPRFTVESAGGAPTFRASFSESGRYIDADGDNGGLGPCCGSAPPAAEPNRWNEWTPTGPGVLATKYLQGSQRFMRLALTSPGKIVLGSAGVDFKAFRAGPRDYRGWFLSNDAELNRIWFSGAYTVQLNMVPPGAQGGNARPQVVDGAKRDRSIWSGDLVVQNPVIWDTLGRRGSQYVKQSLITLTEGADPSGALPGIRTLNGGGFIYSETYSMHAANAMVDYFRYTGDRRFARRMLPFVRRQLDFIEGMTDGRGLLVSQPGHGPGLCCGWDWNGPYDGPKSGAVTATNAIFFHSLLEAAYLERQLGSPVRAREYEARAKSLRKEINLELFDDATGLYRLSDVAPAETGQDSNVLPVLFGVAPRDIRQGILNRLKNLLWTPFGTSPFSQGTGYSEVISPFVNGFETAARFATGDDGDALNLMHRLWGIMVRKGPDYSGGLWEKMSSSGGVGILTGSDPIDNQSLAHGWAAGPTSQLSEYVLGARPVQPGYRTWVIEPHPGKLRWARGRVPTRFGPIDLAWRGNGRGSMLRGSVKVPGGTSGKVELPPMAGRYRVRLNGKSIGAKRVIRLKGGRRYLIRVERLRQRVSCRPHWVGSWNFSPSTAVGREFNDQTIRTVSNVHFGGSRQRIVLSNRFGDTPVTFDAVTVGLSAGGTGSMSREIADGAARHVRFGGKNSVTIQPGADVRSDPVNLPVRRGSSIVTSLYTSGSTGPSTVHTEARQSSFVAPGDHTSDRSGASFANMPNVALGPAVFFLTRIETMASGDAATVVALGDSLTNGTGSSLDGNGRYPDALSGFLSEFPGTRNLTVTNAGIGGNRVLTDSPDYFPFGGVSALNRLDRDVLSQPGLGAVLLIEGMNDIGSAAGEGRMVSSREVFRGLKQIARRVHRAGRKIFVGTIPPTGDPEKPAVLPNYSTSEVNRTRHEVNRLIRSSHALDGVFDVEKALRDPKHPNRLAERYNSGDGLHPNDAGYARLARTVKRKMLDAVAFCPRPGPRSSG
ncbi:MAG: hypothetical protein H6532_04965 [Thermoleophilales bacterium]|nr:hypothetical protein [Thermoleophilales bacterium]